MARSPIACLITWSVIGGLSSDGGHASPRQARHAMALVVDRGAIGRPLGLPAVACTWGSRGGEPARSQAARCASIAVCAA